MKNICRKIPTWTLALVSTTLWADKEYFADAVNGNDAWDGTAALHEAETQHGPKKTLGAAVALADGTPSIVTVAPGTYDKGEYYISDDGTTNRVVISKPNLTIRSTGGKERTFIVGKRSAANWRGYGEDAIRCIYIKPNMLGLGTSKRDDQATNIVIRGFTICNGATKDASGKNGGGVYCKEPDGGSAATLVDCTVSNCVGYVGGGVYRINAIRTYFTGNHASNYGSAAYQGSFCNCVFAFNYGESAVATPRIAVNCTFAYNEKYVFNGGYTLNAYNCLSFGNGVGNGMSGSNVNIYDSVFAAPTTVTTATDSLTDASEFQCLSPAFQDWRLLAGSSAIGKGQGKWLTEKIILPSGETHRDFLGNPIDTSGSVDCGAVQLPAVTPAGGRLRFGTKATGYRTPFYHPEGVIANAGYGAYHYGTNWPTTYRIKYDTGSTALGCQQFWTWWYNGTEKIVRRPDYAGYVNVVPPHSADDELQINTVTVDKLRYADAVNGNDSWNGLSPIYTSGSTGPKKTLQAVANLSFTDHMLVLVSPGVYDEGGQVMTLSGNSLSNRLYVSGRHIGFVASEGPGTAVLKGAPDPETHGLGPNATRCFAANGSSYDIFLQGIDLTGGYTATEGDPAARGAVGYFGNNPSTLVCDCTVSNNVAQFTDMFYGQAMRVRFLDNISLTTENFRYANFYSCLFARNTSEAAAANRGVIGTQCKCWGCTIDALGTDEVTYTFPDTSYFFGCLFRPASNLGLGNQSASNVFSDNPHFADPTSDDYRLGVLSEALAGISSLDYGAVGTNAFLRLQDDLNGLPLVWKDGTSAAGAVRGTPCPMYAIEGDGLTVEGGVLPMPSRRR